MKGLVESLASTGEEVSHDRSAYGFYIGWSRFIISHITDNYFMALIDTVNYFIGSLVFWDTVKLMVFSPHFESFLDLNILIVKRAFIK